MLGLGRSLSADFGLQLIKDIIPKTTEKREITDSFSFIGLVFRSNAVPLWAQ